MAMVNHAWDVPPLHDPLNVGLLDATHKLHVCLKAYVILMKREEGVKKKGENKKEEEERAWVKKI